MSQSRDPHTARSSRRVLLKGFGMTAAASLGAVSGSHSPAAADPPTEARAGDPAKRHRLHGIDPDDLVAEYRRRGLDELSDAELCQQAAAMISPPPAKGGSSFTLHAPLELLARYGLMPLVDPRERKLARLRMVASAASFEAETTAGPAPAKISRFANPGDAIAEFTRCFHAGDAGGLESIVLQFAAQFGTARLVHVLTPLALPTLTGTSHSHIGLWLLLRHGRGSDTRDAGLLRAAARALASGPNSQLKSFAGMAIKGNAPLAQTPAEVEREILAKLAAPRAQECVREYAPPDHGRRGNRQCRHTLCGLHPARPDGRSDRCGIPGGTAGLRTTCCSTTRRSPSSGGVIA